MEKELNRLRNLLKAQNHMLTNQASRLKTQNETIKLQKAMIDMLTYSKDLPANFIPFGPLDELHN